MYILEKETLEVALCTLFVLLIFTILYSLQFPSESFFTRIVPVLVFFLLFVLVILFFHLFETLTNATDKEVPGGLYNWYSFVIISVLIVYFGIKLMLIANFDGSFAKGIRYLQTLHPTSTIITTCQFLVISYLCPEYPDAKYYLFGHIIFGIHVTVYRFIVPRLITTNEFFDILTDKSEIADHMKTIEGVAEDGNLTENNAQRKQIALFTWYYKNQYLVGHVSLGLTTTEDDKPAYISFWPSGDSQQIGNDWRSGDRSTLEFDVLQERGYPDHIVLFKRSTAFLNEANILLEMNNPDWPPDYHVFRQNCMSTIKTVLIAGGLKTRLFCGENFMIRFPATNTREFADEIPFAFMLPNSPRLVQLSLFLLFSSMDICIKLQLTYTYCISAYAVYYALFAGEGEDFNFLNQIIEYLMQTWNNATDSYPLSPYYIAYFAFCFFAAYFRPIEKILKWLKKLIVP